MMRIREERWRPSANEAGLRIVNNCAGGLSTIEVTWRRKGVRCLVHALADGPGARSCALTDDRPDACTGSSRQDRPRGAMRWIRPRRRPWFNRRCAGDFNGMTGRGGDWRRVDGRTARSGFSSRTRRQRNNCGAQLLADGSGAIRRQWRWKRDDYGTFARQDSSPRVIPFR
jgi:hypothetical protein